MGKGSDKNTSNSLISETFSTLLSCQQKMSYSISKQIKAFGITRQQHEVLSILNENSEKPMNLNEVKSQLRENVPDISRIVQRLVEKGLIRRSRQLVDRRHSAISINKEGVNLLHQIEPTIKANMDDFFGILSKDELEELARIIKKVNQNKD
jgi:DNA-binding MarR family transcriptional regulator